jgi:ABC-type nitrate/sulfonate/bicarbonate transport system substrate-binding protein
MRLLRGIVPAIAVFAASVSAHAQDVRVGYWATGASAAIGIVLQHGKFLEAEGLRPSWITVTKIAEVNRALISKSIDIAAAGGTLPSLQLGAEKVPTTIIQSNLIADANFVVPANSPIKSLADLKGKKMGSTPAGSTMYALVSAILEGNYGLKPTDYKATPSGEAQLLAFLERGEVDAAVLRTITLRTFGQASKLRVISTVPEEWKKLIKTDSPPVLGVVVVDTDFAAKNPDTVVKYLVASIKATRWGADNPDKVAEMLQRELQMTPEDAKGFAGSWKDTYFASFSEADMASLLKMAEIFKEGGTFTGTPSKALFTPSFMEKANAAVRN